MVVNHHISQLEQPGSKVDSDHQPMPLQQAMEGDLLSPTMIQPRPAHTGIPGIMTVSPLPPLGLGVAGRAPGCGRKRRAPAHAQTHGRPHSDGPAAPAPGRGAESRAGEGSRRADGKQPKVATDRKRK